METVIVDVIVFVLVNLAMVWCCMDAVDEDAVYLSDSKSTKTDQNVSVNLDKSA